MIIIYGKLMSDVGFKVAIIFEFVKKCILDYFYWLLIVYWDNKVNFSFM